MIIIYFVVVPANIIDLEAVTDVVGYDGNGNSVPGTVSYGFQRCFNLGTKEGNPSGKDLAQLNADTYHIYALASYFDQWDWAEGIAIDPATLPPPSP